MEPILSVKDLSVSFKAFSGTVRAVRDVNFDLYKGETLAIVGESGSGKSVTTKAILGILPKNGHIDNGEVLYRGEDMTKYKEKDFYKIRGKRISLVFQDPLSALNPIMKIGKQITEALILSKSIERSKAKERAIELMEAVGIPNAAERYDAYPFQFSGGMRQRIVIAIALASNPEILICDEPTTALDVTIQAQILDLLRRLRDDTGMAVLLITHDLGVVSETADRVVVMYCGQVVEEAEVRTLFDHPMHPYTLGLLKSIPRLEDDDSKRLYMIKGMVPNPLEMPPGCHFSDRCDSCMDICRTKVPELVDVDGHKVRCFLYESADGEVKSEEAIARAEAEALADVEAAREVETAEALLAAEDLREAEIEEIEKEEEASR